MLLNELFEMICHPGDKVLDIGAFEGELTLLFSGLTGPSGCVHAFEPHPEHFLKLALEAFQSPLHNIHPYCRSISDFSGHRPVYLAPPVTAKSSSVVPGLGTAERLGEGVQVCLIETQTLDDFVRSTGCVPDMIKIDTEGAERLVFQGGKKVLESIRPKIVFEGYFGYDEHHQAYCFNEAVPLHAACLEEIGYNLLLIDIDFFRGEWVTGDSPLHASKYRLLSVTADDFRRMPVIGCNLLAIPDNSSEMLHRIQAVIGGSALEYLADFGGCLPQR